MHLAAAFLAAAFPAAAPFQNAPADGANLPLQLEAWVADAPGRAVPPDSDGEPAVAGEGEDGRHPEGRPPFHVSLEGSRGSRGEASAQAVVQWRGEGFALGLGAEGAFGPLHAARQGWIVQGEVALPAFAIHGELRARPAAAGASRCGAELGARLEGAAGSLDLSFLAASAQAALDPRGSGVTPGARAELASIGAVLDAEAALSSRSAAGLRIAAFAHQLRWQIRPPPHPWDALGAAAQEWPDRWEALASLRGAAGPLSLGVSAGAGAPAAAGAIAARGAIRAELEAGAATWAASLGAAHQWPADLWLAELTVAASFRFGGR